MDINTNVGANYRVKDSSQAGFGSGPSLRDSQSELRSSGSSPRTMSGAGVSQSTYVAPLAPREQLGLGVAPTYVVEASKQLLSIPSLYALGFTGLLNLLVLILVIYHRETLGTLSIYQILCLILFINISLALHGLLHMGAEAVYGFNPLMDYFN